MISDSKWYFFAERRTYVHIQRTENDSKVVRKLLDQKSKLPFM